MPSAVLNASWANIAANNARRIEAFKPRLDMPYTNGAFHRQIDEQKAKGDTERTQKWPTHYLSAEEAIYLDVEESELQKRKHSMHMDRDPGAFIRWYIYTMGSIELWHTWPSVSPFFSKLNLPKYKQQFVEIEAKARRGAIKFIFSFLLRTIARTGGMDEWSSSRFEDRYRVFSASFDKNPYYFACGMHEEERKSVDFASMYGLRPEDKKDELAPYRKLNKIKFVRLAEAAFVHCFKHCDGLLLWAVHEAWKSVATDSAIVELGLAAEPEKIPATLFGQPRPHKRQRTTYYQGSRPLREIELGGV
ncbi:unnamed protein product [Cercospora beticola]|nr:unnamed protein product [Cercospora beticola]